MKAKAKEMTAFVTFRCEPELREKLEGMAESNSASLGWVLRSLIDRAELVTPALFVGNVHRVSREEERYA